MKIRPLFIVIRKELMQFLKDPRTLAMLVFPPAIQLVVFGYVATMDLKEVNFAVLDHSNSMESRALLAEFRGSRNFKEHAPLRSEQEMADRLADRTIKMAVVIPPPFARDFYRKGGAAVQINVDGRNSSSGGIALGYAANIIAEFNRKNAGSGPSVTIQNRPWYNPNYLAYYYMTPALLAVILLLDILLLSSLGLARERECGTLDQLRMTPLSTAEILGGKLLSVFLVGICQVSSGLLVILFWFKVPFNSSFAALYLLFLFFICASAGMGMLISVFAKTLQQAMLLAFMYGIPAVTLSGMISPVESMPEFFQIVTRINPVRHGVGALQRLFLEGVTMRQLLPMYFALFLLGTACIGLAGFLFERQRNGRDKN